MRKLLLLQNPEETQNHILEYLNANAKNTKVMSDMCDVFEEADEETLKKMRDTKLILCDPLKKIDERNDFKNQSQQEYLEGTLLACAKNMNIPIGILLHPIDCKYTKQQRKMIRRMKSKSFFVNIYKYIFR
jgi:hypothetical protein